MNFSPRLSHTNTDKSDIARRSVIDARGAINYRRTQTLEAGLDFNFTLQVFSSEADVPSGQLLQAGSASFSSRVKKKTNDHFQYEHIHIQYYYIYYSYSISISMYSEPMITDGLRNVFNYVRCANSDVTKIRLRSYK